MKKGVLKTAKKAANKLVNSELFIIFIGLVLFLKMYLFYSETIYQSECINFSIVSKTFIFSMFIVTILFLLKNRLRFLLGLIINIFFSTLMFADNLYYNYSTSLISVSQISNLQYSEQITAVIKDLMNIFQLLYFIDIFIILILLSVRFIKIEKIKEKNWKPAFVYTFIMVIVYSSTIQTYVQAAQSYSYNKKMQLEAGTLYTFHFLDVKSNFNLKKTAKYTTKDDVLEAYNNLKSTYNENYNQDIYKFSSFAKDKNVILLQLESFQDFLLYKTINGKEITPNLNKFMSENIQFNNFIIQSYATTADSEHSAMTSLYPLENGMAFAQYSSNKYDDIFGKYKEAGYYTMYMHGNDGAFWNRKNVYRLLDIDEIDFIDSFDSDSQRINDWISDEELYRQAVKKLKVIDGPFFVNIVSASSHTAFDLPGLENKYDIVNIDVGKYKDTYFGNYLESVNYADYAFGIFIDELKDANLYDNTLICVFGDHYGMQMYNYEMLEFIENTEHQYNIAETEINYANTVCGLKIPGVNEHIQIDKTVSKLDIKPTLVSLSGLNDEISLGTNMFGTKDFACLSNGIIVTDNYYFNGIWYNKRNGEKIDFSIIDEETKKKLNYYITCMENEIAISNSIILNNLLK